MGMAPNQNKYKVTITCNPERINICQKTNLCISLFLDLNTIRKAQIELIINKTESTRRLIESIPGLPSGISVS